MLYQVIKQFIDLEDGRRAYRPDDWYPRHAFNPSKKHLERLIAGGYIAVQEDSQSEYPMHTGGGWYELSSGEKVQGKQEAEKAEADLS